MECLAIGHGMPIQEILERSVLVQQAVGCHPFCDLWRRLNTRGLEECTREFGNAERVKAYGSDEFIKGMAHHRITEVDEAGDGPSSVDNGEEQMVFRQVGVEQDWLERWLGKAVEALVDPSSPGIVYCVVMRLPDCDPFGKKGIPVPGDLRNRRGS